MELLFRKRKTEDFEYIADSWQKEYRKGPFASQIHSDVFFPNYRARIKALLEISETIVACNPEDEDQVYGYAVHRRIGPLHILSWINVKGTFRGLGIGHRMFKEIGEVDIVTHLSRYYKTRWDEEQKRYVTRLPDGLVYNPFIDLEVPV